MMQCRCDKSETLMSEIKDRIQYANMSHEEHKKHTKEFEQRVEEIKANLKVAMENDMASGDFVDIDFGFEGANKKGYASISLPFSCIGACSFTGVPKPHRRGKMKGPGMQMERLRRR